MASRSRPPLPLKPRLTPTVVALYPYDAQDTDELSFQPGDLIELVQKRWICNIFQKLNPTRTFIFLFRFLRIYIERKKDTNF